MQQDKPEHTGRKSPRMFRPVAVGFLGMAVPLFIATAYAQTTTSVVCNVAAGMLMVVLGLILFNR